MLFVALCGYGRFLDRGRVIGGLKTLLFGHVAVEKTVFAIHPVVDGIVPAFANWFPFGFDHAVAHD
jgi:hypothetical protein